MRSRKKQRELRRAGITREESIPARNEEGYIDLTPREAVEDIRKKQRGAGKETAA